MILGSCNKDDTSDISKEVKEGILYRGELTGNTQTILDFDCENALYKVIWYNNWFDTYTVPSLWVRVNYNDGEEAIHQTRLIQMTGSAIVINAVAANLKLKYLLKPL